jgi:hypothetical protein
MTIALRVVTGRFGFCAIVLLQNSRKMAEKRIKEKVVLQNGVKQKFFELADWSMG